MDHSDHLGDEADTPSLVQLARDKALPPFQRMDRETVRWIRANQPAFPEGADLQLPALDPAVVNTLDRAAAIRSTWYAEPDLFDSLHGIRHALRTAVNGALLARLHGIPIEDQVALVIAAAIHDCRRRHDQDDPGHGDRAAAWLSDNHHKVAYHFQTGITIGLRRMQAALRLHEVPYAHFSPPDRAAPARTRLLVDLLKTADALDRYRQPKLKWWPDVQFLRLVPPANVARLAYELVCDSEQARLSGVDSASSVVEALKERGLL
jgi:hypothetical protein